MLLWKLPVPTSLRIESQLLLPSMMSSGGHTIIMMSSLYNAHWYVHVIITIHVLIRCEVNVAFEVSDV